MPVRRSPSLVLLALLSAQVASAGTPIHVFILAGQSNALGKYVSASSLPSSLRPGVPDVLFWYEEGTYQSVSSAGLRIDSDDDFVPLDSQDDPAGTTFGTSDDPITNGYASEITAGRDLLDEIGGKIAFVKFAFGGTGIQRDWSPGDGGSLFWELIDVADDAAAELQSRGFDPEFSGFFWMQGEYDADGQTTANRYEGRLGTFVDRMRDELGAPGMKFVIGRLSRHMDLPYVDTVRAAQEDVAAESPLNFMVNTDDLNLRSDDLHFVGAGHRTLGSRFASLGLPDSSPPPELEVVPLTGGRLVWGRYIGGNLTSIQSVDTSDVIVDSTLNGTDWRAGIQVTASSPHLSIDQLRLTVRVETDETPVTAGAMAYNVASGQWDVISFFSFSGGTASLALDLSSPASYVAASGQVLVRILSLSRMQDVPAGHELRVDQVQVEVKQAS